MLFNNFYLSSFPLLGGGKTLVCCVPGGQFGGKVPRQHPVLLSGDHLGLAFGYFVNVFLSS